MQRSCITGTLSLRHLKTEFFRLKMDFKKKKKKKKRESYMAQKALPQWVNVIKKIFDKIENNVQNAKDDNLQARPPGGVINFIKSNKLIKEIACCKIIHEEVLERITSIRDDICGNIYQETLTPNQVEVLNIIFMVKKIFNGKTKFVKANNDVFEQESNIARLVNLAMFRRSIESSFKSLWLFWCIYFSYRRYYCCKNYCCHKR